MPSTTRLLVSVRSVHEALAALAGGADLIDVKEPANGPLGVADVDVQKAVLNAVAGRREVSAALGELAGFSAPPVMGVTFAKWGLASLGSTAWSPPPLPERAKHGGTAAQPVSPPTLADPHHGRGNKNSRWQIRWLNAIARLPAGCQPVAVAYADARAAGAPAVHEVFAFALEQRVPFLIDTAVKDGRTLLDHIPVETLRGLTRQARGAGIRVALAGSLDFGTIERLLPLRPDWIAVRGAACDGGRPGIVSEARVRDLARLVHGWGE